MLGILFGTLPLIAWNDTHHGWMKSKKMIKNRMCVWKIFKDPVNIISLVDGLIKWTLSILGVKNDVDTEEERYGVWKINQEVETKQKKCVWWKKVYHERPLKLSAFYPPHLRKGNIGNIPEFIDEILDRFERVVTNTGSIGVLKNTVEWIVEVLSDCGNRSENSRDRDDTEARISTVVVKIMK